MENSKLKLILASASPRRFELLGHLKIPFEVKTFNVPEISHNPDPKGFAQEIAYIKGKIVVDDLITNQPDENYFVISADTIVCLDNKIYGKPKNTDEARTFLKELSGKTHSVFTAVCGLCYFRGQLSSFSFVDESKVTFNQLDSRLMETYLLTGDSLDKAGAYGIQGPSLTFISNVEGSYSNVVGFPLSRFIQETEAFFQSKISSELLWYDLF
jgi:septum formation protein